MVRSVSGFGQAAEAILFRPKDPKRLTPRPAILDGRGASFKRRTNSLRSHKARLVLRASLQVAGRQASATEEVGGYGLGVTGGLKRKTNS